MTVGILRGWGPRRETPDPVLGKRMTSELSPEDGPMSQEQVRPCGEAQRARDGALAESEGAGAAAKRGRGEHMATSSRGPGAPAMEWWT